MPEVLQEKNFEYFVNSVQNSALNSQENVEAMRLAVRGLTLAA